MMTSTNDRPLRIAFVGKPGKAWMAGTHYFKNLFLALRSLDSDLQPEIILLVAYQAGLDSHRSLSPYVDHVLQMPSPSWRDTLRRLAVRMKRMPTWLELEPALGPYLRKNRVDVVFGERSEFGPRFRLPLLSWIPDFQHFRLPEMFSQAEIQQRNERFSRVADHATRVILSSRDARRDFEQFAPQAAHKARVLSFVAQIPSDIYDSDPGWVCDYYRLPGRFIYLPNQFWKHKNHDIVLQALCLAKNERPDVAVVCTGSTKEDRAPLYFSELLARISNMGLRDNMIILGLVPHDHVFGLLRQSVSVLQPSLFEGWSTTVEEVKSVGKRLILSDIPVHREQNPPQATFFDPRDPEALADCLLRAFDEHEPGPDYRLEVMARKQLPRRTKQFGQAFVRIVQEIGPLEG